MDSESRAVPGYPAITDPEHPLWDAQQAGWPDHAAHEAMTEAVRLNRGDVADSADHPAYAADRIRNPQAERPEAPYWLDAAAQDRR